MSLTSWEKALTADEREKLAEHRASIEPHERAISTLRQRGKSRHYRNSKKERVTT